MGHLSLALQLNSLLFREAVAGDKQQSTDQRNNNDEIATKTDSPLKSEDESPETDVGFNVEEE